MKKVLVVDDEAYFRSTVVKALRCHAYETIEAPGAEQGLTMAREQSPDLVLTDLNMIGADGFWLLKNLRADPRTSVIPVILMTGGSQKSHVRESMELGADDYLPKPFGSEALIAAVEARLTRQQALQAQAKAHEARLLDILSATQDLVAIAEAETSRLLYLNPAGRKMLGIAPEEDFTRLHLSDFHVDREPVDRHSGKLAYAYEKGAWIGECAFVSREGRQIPVSKQILVHPAPGGGVAYISIVARDITERKEAADRVARSERLLRTILDVLPQRVFWKDKQGRYEGANNQFLADCGSNEIIGRTDYELGWTRNQADAFGKEDAVVIESGRPKLDTVHQITLQSGKSMWLSTSRVPLRNEGGEVVGVLGTYLDITSIKQDEHERQLMEVQLRQALKLEAVGQLAAGIAHEINTPTQYVGDNVRFFQESFGNLRQVFDLEEELVQAAKENRLTPQLLARADQVREASDLPYLFEQIPVAITETLEGVERITKIVRAMKEFSHPGGKEKSAVDLNRAIESTVTVARNEWKYVAEVKLELEPTLAPVPCFLGEFNQIVLNLVINAAHAIADVVKTQPGTKGTITIQTRRDGDEVEVRVRDTGTGIPEAIRPRIFEPFFTTKGVGKGTGQGLSIVYGSVVKKHGGTVRFESELGKGTTFIVRLPIKTQTAEPIAQPVEAARL